MSADLFAGLGVGLLVGVAVGFKLCERIAKPVVEDYERLLRALAAQRPGTPL